MARYAHPRVLPPPPPPPPPPTRCAVRLSSAPFPRLRLHPLPSHQQLVSLFRFCAPPRTQVSGLPQRHPQSGISTVPHGCLPPRLSSPTVVAAAPTRCLSCPTTKTLWRACATSCGSWPGALLPVSDHCARRLVSTVRAARVHACRRGGGRGRTRVPPAPWVVCAAAVAPQCWCPRCGRSGAEDVEETMEGFGALLTTYREGVLRKMTTR